MTVGIWDSSPQADSEPRRSALFMDWQLLVIVLHSSHQPDELAEWLYHVDGTISVVLSIIIIIIIIVIFLPSVGIPERVLKLWIAKQLRVRYSVRAVCGRQRVVQQLNGIETLR